MEFFLCNKRKTAVKRTIDHISAVSLVNFKITDHKYWFWVLEIIVFVADRLFGQTTKQPLNNFEPQKPLKAELFK